MISERLTCRRREVLHLHPTKKKNKKRGVLLWACLPSELLSVISGCLQDAADIIRFRSVCRSWRFSTPLLHKVSPFFPFVFSISADISSPNPIERETEILASAVYLLRPRRDPSKAWMVYAQELAPGKLIFRHPLTLNELPDEKWPNLSSDEWSSVTQIARSYNHFTDCSRCKAREWIIRFALVTPISSNPRSGSYQLIRLGIKGLEFSRLFVYSRGGGGDPTTGKCHDPHCRVTDFTVFNGRIYACEFTGVLYVLDHTKLELIPLIPASNLIPPFDQVSWIRLVVWDGGLYAVVVHPCKELVVCYRLVEDEGNCRWEKVEDLGDGVLFLTKDCVFSMSARDLPPPWRGNSIVLCRGSRMFCTWKTEVFELGVEGAKYEPISSFRGYSQLFAPPLTCS